MGVCGGGQVRVFEWVGVGGEGGVVWVRVFG